MSQLPPEQSEAYALIIDTSASATPYLDEARRMAQLIYDLIGVVDEEQFKLFALGSTTPLPLTALRQTGQPVTGRPSKPCSLIAPIMETLAQDGIKRSVIIVGNGEIFDLDDWTGDPGFDGWLLVRTGEQSLQGPDGAVSEITARQVGGDADTLLSYFSWFDGKGPEPPRPGGDGGACEWRVDATGYPLVFVEPLEAYVQLFPITKPQFEKFIASGGRRECGDEWYAELLTLNPRASYRSPDVPARERLFMTGVTPDEALAFGRWMGRDYALLTAQEWGACYKWFERQAAPPAPPEIRDRLSRDALGVWGLVEGQWLGLSRQPNLRELSLMTQGILEWVTERPGRYCGLGEPAASKLQRRAEDPVRPVGRGRLRNLGFRLRAR